MNGMVSTAATGAGAIINGIDPRSAGGQAILASRARPREVIHKGYRDEVTDADFADVVLAAPLPVVL